MTSIIARKFINAGIVVAAGLALGLGAAMPAHADDSPIPTGGVTTDSFARTFDCASRAATVTDTVYFAPYVYLGGNFVLGTAAVSQVAVFTVALDVAEQAACAAPAPTAPYVPSWGTHRAAARAFVAPVVAGDTVVLLGAAQRAHLALLVACGRII